jgi:ABC-type xylose transport system substrate-binding protein
VTRQVAKKREEDVDQQVTAAASNEESRRWREDDSNLEEQVRRLVGSMRTWQRTNKDEKNVRAANCHVVGLEVGSGYGVWYVRGVVRLTVL